MPKLLIPFDTDKHHIYIHFELVDHDGIARNGLGILDTGAPRTEFSDLFLKHADLFDIPNSNIHISANQETKKYNRIVIPSVTICGYEFINAEFLVSRFEKEWGIDALIGLDLFRKSMITIDYKNSQIISEPY
ncbi:MAG: hypothetical protein PVI26_12045 [Chitinispirillia bacterium]|jgi:hypothetical protein